MIRRCVYDGTRYWPRFPTAVVVVVGGGMEDRRLYRLSDG